MSTSDLSYKDYSFADHKEVYQMLEKTFRAFGIHYYLIGANARDVALYIAGIKPTRATADIDFAVMIPDIQTYKDIRSNLLKNGFTTSSENFPYRLFYHPSKSVVDLLPYGDFQLEQKSTLDYMHFTLSGIGMREVGEEINQFEHPEGFTLPVSPAHGIVILKLISWSEMPDRNKDLKDIKALLDAAWELYEAEIFQKDSPFTDLFDDDDFDTYLTAARVMGRKMRTILDKNQALKQAIITEIEKELTLSSGPKSQQIARDTNQNVSEIKEIFTALLTGINDV